MPTPLLGAERRRTDRPAALGLRSDHHGDVPTATSRSTSTATARATASATPTAGAAAWLNTPGGPAAPSYANVPVTHDPFPAHSEPMLVENPRNPRNLVAGSTYFSAPTRDQFKIGAVRPDQLQARNARLDGRPTAQWSRLATGRSDDLGAGTTATTPHDGQNEP